MAQVLMIAGPTASGKSAAALQIAAALNGEIINADSMQVYKALEIITAQPSAADQTRVPHHLYGVLEVTETCSAGRWVSMALPIIEEVLGRGRLPVVVGGTGLYLKALSEGLNEIPATPPEVRRKFGAILKDVGPKAFHQLLQQRDPETAARLHPTDTQRVLRAVEVLEVTGKPLSQWQAEPLTPPTSHTFLKALLLPPRPQLYNKIDDRVVAMLEAGAFGEAKRLAVGNHDRSLTALRAVGVPQLLSVVAGEKNLEEALADIQQATRNYAKRQYTWFRNQYKADIVAEEPLILVEAVSQRLAA